MANPITVVTVSLSSPATPSGLQKKGAIISQGGTTLSALNDALLTEPDDLTALLPAPLAITSIAWANTFGGQLTVTATASHGVAVNEQFVTTIAGALPVGYNGTYLATSTGAATFTALQPVNPGNSTATTPGTYTRRGVGDLQAAVNTFFAQGTSQSVYVLELGPGEPAAGVTALSTFISTNQPQVFYSYLVPKDWDGVASYLTFLAGFEATTSKTYFYTTTTLQTYGLYTDAMKDVNLFIEAPAYGAWPINALTAASFTTGLITATTTTAHTVIPGQYFTITGVSPAGYNGTFRALPGTSGSSLVYAVATDPTSYVSGGNLLPSFYTSAGTPATEFTHAADWFTTLNWNPTVTTPVTPLEYSDMSGVTAFPTRGNSALLNNLLAANVSYASTAAAGGLPGAILQGGNFADGHPVNYWYNIDWMAINQALNLTNEVINGSKRNNPNPLILNQAGIDRLQLRALATGNSAIAFDVSIGSSSQTHLDQFTFNQNTNLGQYDGQLVVNAVPLTSYYAASPGDYKIGKYAGLTLLFTPARGFDQVFINIVASEFVASGA